MTLDQATDMQNDAIRINDLLIWVITENPSDFPGKLIARPTSIRMNAAYLRHLEADTLDQLRTMLPAGLTRMQRDPSDDPVIVESWI